MGFAHAVLGTTHRQHLLEARHAYFEQGLTVPDGLVNRLITRSWERCRTQGLPEISPKSHDPVNAQVLRGEQERNRELLTVARPVMEHVFEQIADSGSMVILADRHGLLLETVGDPDFVDRAARVSLSAGASWDEVLRGTNAIGTALAEECPIEVIGPEHYLANNGFLTCCASPVFAPDGQLAGVLDISGDYRGYQPHTLGLVRVSSAMMEKRLFEARYAREMWVCFHPHAEYLGSLKEGIAAVTPDGQILAINRQGLTLLGLRRFDAVNRDFGRVFETSLASLIDVQRTHPLSRQPLCQAGKTLQCQIRGQLPAGKRTGITLEPNSNRPAFRGQGDRGSRTSLDSLNTGDPVLGKAILRAKRILGKDIPLLIQGESGVGKEVFAQAFHQSSSRRQGHFVALNCASIPESLIESELFGYQGGAFTGARKEGAPGKIQQAHGGTLFLDEIGDMPLGLQARLLRVLQERCVTPLGSLRTIPVDISLICATHRNLREAVLNGSFREDLYYRLNGLSVTLPPLRERTDFSLLVEQILQEVSGGRSDIKFSSSALARLAAYAWPGNVRQLGNALRLAVALLDEDETQITENHLPDEVIEPALNQGQTETAKEKSASTHTLGAQTRQAITQALTECRGNVSAAARLLGISRATLYRKLSQIETTVPAHNAS